MDFFFFFYRYLHRELNYIKWKGLIKSEFRSMVSTGGMDVGIMRKKHIVTSRSWECHFLAWMVGL